MIMKRNNNVNEILEQVIAVWRTEGADPKETDTAFYNIQNDPVTRLLLSAITHQTNLLSDDLDDFIGNLLEEYMELGIPEHLLQPIPAVGMIQTAKRHKVGCCNEAATWINADTHFIISAGKNNNHAQFNFLPLLEIAVYDLNIHSIQYIGKSAWHVVLEDQEGLSSLKGLSIFIPRAHKCREMKLFSNGRNISTCDINGIERLPFIEPFLSTIHYSKNIYQLSTIQVLFDSICCHANSYCIVDDTIGVESLQYSNGCIEFDIELMGESEELNLKKEDILINCTPVFNADPHLVTLSQEKPLYRLDLRGCQLLSVIPAATEMEYKDTVVVRSVGTERMSLNQWQTRMKRLIDYYDSEYNILKTVVEEKILNTLQQFISGIHDTIKEKMDGNDAIYLILKERLLPSIDVLWYSTRGKESNGLGPDATVNVLTAELDSSQTRLITKTSGGHDTITNREKRHRALNYWQPSRDRIISRMDIIAFCRYKLTSFFDIADNNIKDIRLRPDVVIMPDGLYERVIVADIHLTCTTINVEETAIVLERMIKSRTCGLSTILVSIHL